MQLPFLDERNYQVMNGLRNLALFAFFNLVIYVTYWKLDIKMIFYTRNAVKYYSYVEWYNYNNQKVSKS